MTDQHGIKLWVVDYLQKIPASRRQEMRSNEVGDIAEMLVGVAQETNTAVLCLAQLNRESEKDKGRQPRLSDLGESGKIEQHADAVALLYRDRSIDKGKLASLIIAKQRDGDVGVVELSFNGQFCRFESVLV